MRHFGGKMLETRTRLQAAIPADRNASSNEVSFSRCFPTPLVKNISFGTNPTTLTLLARLSPDQTVGSSALGGGPSPPLPVGQTRSYRKTSSQRVCPTGTQHGKHRLSHCQGILPSS